MTGGVCRGCRTPFLTGPDEEIAAFVAAVDPTPLDRIGEMLAVLDGRRTYELRRHGRGLALWRRDRRAIKSRPPEGAGFDVVPDHRCGAVLPAVVTVHRQPKDADHDRCPF